MKRLILWDIDSTLVDTRGAGHRSLVRALEQQFGIEDSLAWLDYSGRTDYWIARTILEHHGHTATAAAMQAYLDTYVRSLADEMPVSQAHVLPGIREILVRIASTPDHLQGLLTGNLQRGAHIKLHHLNLWSFFPFGAFADDAENRNHLGPVALERAGQRAREPFAPEEVIVIGDTPLDIACGKAIGAHTVAVATGRFPIDILKRHTPTAALSDFSRPEPFLALLS